jgi:hypothetical protein
MMYTGLVGTASQYVRKDGKIPIFIVYRRPVAWTDRLLQVACGEFTHCEIYVPNIGGTFVTTTDSGMQLRFDLKRHYTSNPSYYAWHLIALTECEYDRMNAWHMEQVTNHCAYNYRDLLKLPLTKIWGPWHDLGQNDANHPKRMFCSQAVVLALRAAFNDGNNSGCRMKSFISSMNSRITTPGCLVKDFAGYMGVAANNCNIPMDVKQVNSYTDDVVAKQAELELGPRLY